MEERMIKFVAALRNAGVRISLAESADAFAAVDRLGVKDRETFKLGLQTTLVKEARDMPAFEELFPIFFGSSDSPPLMDISQDLIPEEAEQLTKALRQFSKRMRRMMERLINGEQLSEKDLERKLLQANMGALEDQMRQFAGQRIAENMSQGPSGESIDNLLKRPFSSLSEADMDRLREEVQRLAAALKTRVTLRQKRSKSGQLDPKATIRANLKHGNVPIKLKYRDRLQKPRLVVMCDISTSMRSCSELMLSLLHALQDQISKTYSFAFINHLEYISPDFERRGAGEAVARVLDRMPSGFYNTDFGAGLMDFNRSYMDKIDSRTTFIVVGDGRNNFHDPRLELFDKISRRSRRTIWLTPEGPMLWGSGDSDMLKYAPMCDVILQAGTLNELTSAVDKLLLG
jgi:uncharacterized protein with von Willebrand factor type A (vWA) domain